MGAHLPFSALPTSSGAFFSSMGHHRPRNKPLSLISWGWTTEVTETPALYPGSGCGLQICSKCFPWPLRVTHSLRNFCWRSSGRQAGNKGTLPHAVSMAMRTGLIFFTLGLQNCILSRTPRSAFAVSTTAAYQKPHPECHGQSRQSPEPTFSLNLILTLGMWS